MSKNEIKEISVIEYIDKCDDLITLHWQEIAKNKQLMVLKPNVAMYRNLEESGMLLSLGAYSDGVLVGYSVNTLYNHLHYSDLSMCQNDVLYIHPDFRNTRLGLSLIKETEAKAKEKGVDMMLWHAKENSALDKLMPRLGYGVQDIIYSKGL